ncbi:MAG: ATP-binding protein [Methylococcales bacterium]|nr:ATP-binding protein [Methylococcales bacterium]
MTNSLKLPLAALKAKIDLSDIDFTESLNSQSTILGQERAQSALEFGIAMPNSGYNIFVMGETGSGRLSMIMQYLQALAPSKPAPPSYAYVDNFENAREPIAIKLPAEHGQDFLKAIENLITNVLATFPATFENPSYQQKKTAVERQFVHTYRDATEYVDAQAREINIGLFSENDTFNFLPLCENKPMRDEDLSALSTEERELYKQRIEELEDCLSEALLELPQWRRELAASMTQLNNDTIDAAIEPLFDELNARYAEVEDVVTYLAEVKQNLRQTINDYLMPVSSNEPIERDHILKKLILEQYAPNILIDYKQDSGAPVIYETHPTYQNLFGRVEYSNDQGTLVPHYRRICAGALHKANGGYLILDAEKVLHYPFVWDGLKRSLKSGYIEIESPFTEQSINTITLKPEVIPLNVKIILVGNADIFYLLEAMDDEFNESFRVLADFDYRIPRTPETMKHFAQLMIKQATDAKTQPLTQAAIESLIEHSCRLAESQAYFSACINDALEIIGEAQLFATKTKAEKLDRLHIEQALNAREYRNGRMSQTILEEMLDGTILIDTDGAAIGKINGLTVLDMGGSSFGMPARITTTVHPGSRGVVDIEREVELGQALHSKGVMILTGYLGHCYAQQFPLAISASIAMEQSYGHIDGDSASLAELCSLISALTRTKIKQNFAVTGSINQYGEVQAIGGANEKIEGFFRLCKARGLNGSHGVIIPAANKRNLMLKQEILDAVEAELFSIYAVNTVDEALELLTGEVVGILDAEGNVVENSVNYKAICRLKEISELSDDEKEESES